MQRPIRPEDLAYMHFAKSQGVPVIANTQSLSII
jgi:hypothetical protein